LMIGAGFLITACVAFAISIEVAVFGLLMLVFASYFLGTGIARILQSRALKRLLETRDVPPTLPSGQTEYLKPSGSIYETEELGQLPSSITERTTTLLGFDRESDKR
jgi:hypothetical protein